MSDETWEKWRDRLFSLAVPIFLGYLLAKDAGDGSVDSEILVVVMAGYGTGLAAAVIRRLTGVPDDEGSPEDHPDPPA